MGGFIDVLRKARATVVPVCAAWAITANRLLRADFERLAGEFEEISARRSPMRCYSLCMERKPPKAKTM